jgi:lisH domain-containing protein FOPNL
VFHRLAVRETLENRGVLDQLRARIRAEVFSALDDPTDTKCEVSRENVIINELIREYLEYNRYRYTASVFSSGDEMFAVDLCLKHIICLEVL